MNLYNLLSSYHFILGSLLSFHIDSLLSTFFTIALVFLLQQKSGVFLVKDHSCKTRGHKMLTVKDLKPTANPTNNPIKRHCFYHMDFHFNRFSFFNKMACDNWQLLQFFVIISFWYGDIIFLFFCTTVKFSHFEEIISLNCGLLWHL